MPDTLTRRGRRQRLSDAAANSPTSAASPTDQRGGTPTPPASKLAADTVHSTSTASSAPLKAAEAYDLRRRLGRRRRPGERRGKAPNPRPRRRVRKRLTRDARSVSGLVVTDGTYQMGHPLPLAKGRLHAPCRSTRRSCSRPSCNTLSGDDTDASLFAPRQPRPPPPPARCASRLCDVLSVRTTGLSAIPYVREENPATSRTGATGVAEGGLARGHHGVRRRHRGRQEDRRVDPRHHGDPCADAPTPPATSTPASSTCSGAGAGPRSSAVPAPAPN